MKFRAKTPERSSGVVKQNDYHKYRDQLATDFHHRCGYCDDKDSPRKASFEIDHFVPKTRDKSRTEDYTNLVYACKSCNNAKSDTWPTGDASISNDGRAGWIDPCDKEYDEHFERDEKGKIHPLTILGQWMYKELKLFKKQHAILWNIERLDTNIEEIIEKFGTNDIIPNEQKDALLQIYQEYHRYINKLYKD